MYPLLPIQRTVYTGTFIHTPHLGILEVLEHTAVGVDESGVIVFIDSNPRLDLNGLGDEDLEDRYAVRWKGDDRSCRVVRGVGQGRGWWVPGFVDTHIHASQYPNTGIFGKTTLLSWLTTYTFPLESSLSLPQKARAVYSRCISRTLSHGTTCAAYFATIHVESTNILSSLCLEKGQRAFIGRVCMDNDINPAYLRDENPAKATKDTEATIAHIRSIDPTHELITPIITPRFAPSCSFPLLSSLGDLARREELPIQTHISENASEIALVSSLFPEHASYAAVYDAASLLTPRTVLAHAIHLSPAERALVKKRGAGVSHCPVSNTSLSSGCCPVRELLREGIEVGLGTDVSGGWSASILVAIREAGMVSRTLAWEIGRENREGKKVEATLGGKEVPVVEEAASLGGGLEVEQVTGEVGDDVKLSIEECLYLATRGGAKCLGLGGKVGAFEVGMEWDVQMVELDAAEDYDNAEGTGAGEGSAKKGSDRGLVELWGNETWAEKVAKWVCCGDDRNTKRVYVKGRLVHERG